MGNREIKFRGWDERAKLMHEDFRYIKSGDEGNDWIIFTSSRQTLQEKHHPFENPYFQDQFKIMQYTGLKDANGVEIYEGDIINWQGAVCYIAWENSDASFMAVEQYDTWAESGQEWAGSCKVIGNIYQNQELLNG